MKSFKDLRRLQIDQLSTLKGIIGLLRDPSHTESVYDIEDGLAHSAAMKAAVAHMLANPQIAQLAQDRYIAPSPNLAQLMLCPPGSLGHGYASYITGFGFDPEFYRKIDIADDTSYLLFRLRQTHDIWHLVTGFSVDVNGELGLKAFELAQTRRTLSGVLLAGAFLQCLFQAPETLDQLLAAISRGYHMGTQAEPLLAQRWEEHWDKPLADCRSDLHITPV
jgi:ubiquinone biosynthesis protein COQ4